VSLLAMAATWDARRTWRVLCRPPWNQMVNARTAKVSILPRLIACIVFQPNTQSLLPVTTTKYCYQATTGS